MAKQNEIKFLTSTRVEKRQKKYCRFKKMGIKYVDYKDAEFLKKFLNEQGKMLPRRISGNSLKFQRKVAQAIKKARQLALLPYVTDLLK
ncbi:30S ribosomal protein S18 [Taibaiella soli]|uniref:30S ribosomal protein S18 n=1 Tax=Taibaiella soli TaxID=1649169 RepID=UPI001A9FB0B5|nr:30S ribosomal protein S18 [Taibaiella soli]